MKSRHAVRLAALLMGAACLIALAGCDLGGAGAEKSPYADSGPFLSRTITSNTTGTDTDGFFYSFWKGANEGGYNGSASMTIDTGTSGNYSTTWSNVSNFTAGKGWANGSATRVVNFSGSFNGGGNGYLALYGWATTSVATPANYSVVEYYIVESYGDWTPPGGNSLGSFTSDGGTYNIYKMTRTNAPWIVNGSNGTFNQYWSVRTSKRSSGTITFANHVAAWAAKSMALNSVSAYYQIMESEGYHSSGSSNITVSEGSSSAAKWYGLGTGTNGTVRALNVTSGGTLYAGGRFTKAGGTTVNYVAKWNGQSWSALGTGLGGVVDAVLSDVSHVYASENAVGANKVKRWNGSTWPTLGETFNGYIYALTFGSDGKLYAAGGFTKNGNNSTLGVARWNGASWVQCGNGLNGEVRALVAGANGAIYAGGYFTKSGNVDVKNIAMWNGTSWAQVGGGVNNGVFTLAYRSNVLYAGGSFSKSGNASIANVAKYSNNSWTSLGTGVNDAPYTFAFDASGNLYVGGAFTKAGGIDAKGVAMWNGSAWSALGSGLSNGPPGQGGSGLAVYALANSSKGIYAGGWFTADTGPHVAIYK